MYELKLFFPVGEKDAVCPDNHGTKVAAHYVLKVPPGGKAVIRVRFYDKTEAPAEAFGADAFDETFENRKEEADDYYAKVNYYFNTKV